MTIATHGGNPAVNIKSYKGLDSVPYTDIYTEPDFNEDWIRRNLPEDHIWDWFCLTSQELLEDLIEEAQRLFDFEAGMDLDIFQAGRSGGWLEVVGLPDQEDWDEDLAAKWDKFEGMCEDTVDDWPISAVENIYHNVYLEEHGSEQQSKAMWDEVENYLFMFASNYDDWVVILPEHMDAFKAACPLLMKKLKE